LRRSIASVRSVHQTEADCCRTGGTTRVLTVDLRATLPNANSIQRSVWGNWKYTRKRKISLLKVTGRQNRFVFWSIVYIKWNGLHVAVVIFWAWSKILHV